PATPEENEEQNQGRRALWEAFEEDARREVSGFQTGQITGLSDRRPQQRAAARSQVRLTIEDVLDTGLPRAYTPEVYQTKCSAIFEHVYESYSERNAGTYA
ncbi:MAG: hypothetical protein NTV93_16475, partial [Verrucomicrobia bacterium]|nr:hypothetical protein [Verrucomicrobiota bacterium]